MKNISLLVWMTQLALSVAVPPVGFILLGVWLNSRFHWGVWTVLAGAVLGVLCGIQGLRSSLKTMERLAKSEAKEKPPVSFNDHD